MLSEESDQAKPQWNLGIRGLPVFNGSSAQPRELGPSTARAANPATQSRSFSFSSFERSKAHFDFAGSVLPVTLVTLTMLAPISARFFAVIVDPIEAASL